MADSTVALPISTRARSPWGRFTRLYLPWLVSDAAAILAACSMAVFIRHLLGGAFELLFYFKLSGVVFLFLLLYAMQGLYPTLGLHPAQEIQRIVRGTTLSFLIVGTMSFFLRDVEAYSRAVILGGWLLTIVVVFSARLALRLMAQSAAWWGEQAVILGPAHACTQLAMMLKQHPSLGFRPVALLTEEPERLHQSPALNCAVGDYSLAPMLSRTGEIRYAIVSMPEASRSELASVLQEYVANFHHVVVIPDLAGIPTLGVDAMDLGGTLGVEIPHRLLFRGPRLVKRSLDIVLGGAGLILLLPFFAVISALVCLSTRSTPFFGQRRVGKNGQEFTVWKFRTMAANAEEVLRKALESRPDLREEWEHDHKLRHDPRITPLGRVLRRTSIDELPQLYNALKGEMSLIGPRPIVKEEIRKYGRMFSHYSRVSPGISGLWQVSGRNDVSYEARVALDEYYVRNWSVWLDFYILCKTAFAVIKGSGAY